VLQIVTMGAEQFVDARTLADRLGLSTRTIYTYVSEGRIPFIRLRHSPVPRYRFNITEVIEHLRGESHERTK